jgi:hypothetical protein
MLSTKNDKSTQQYGVSPYVSQPIILLTRGQLCSVELDLMKEAVEKRPRRQDKTSLEPSTSHMSL